MADKVDRATRSRIMAAVKSKGTFPELQVRRAVHAAGFRYRLHRKDLPGKPDLTFPRFHLAVFVHGCFWHWHGCKNCRMPATNADYWTAKVEGNVARDAEAVNKLASLGWEVRILWECELRLGLDRLLEELASHRDLQSGNS